MNKVDILDAVNITNNRVRPFDGERRYLATGDLSNQGIDGFVLVDYENKPSRADLKVDEGDLIIARMKATNKVFLIGRDSDDLIVSTGFLTLKPKNGFIGKYLYHYFRSESFQRFKDRLCSGATQKAINNNSFKKLKVPHYLTEKQKKIILILDTVDNLRQKRKEQLNLLDDYLKSVFFKKFGDPVVNKKNWHLMNLRDVSEKFSDGPFGSNLKTEHYQGAGVRIVRLQNIGLGEFNNEDKAFISEAHYETIKKHTCKPGDVLIATMGDPNIRACTLPRDINIAINKADCIQLRPRLDIIASEYICSLLNSSSAIYLIAKFLHGQTRTRISMGQLSNLSIPVPPIKLQKDFASIVEQVEETKQKMSASLDEMDNHFNALMQRYFG